MRVHLRSSGAVERPHDREADEPRAREPQAPAEWIIAAQRAHGNANVARMLQASRASIQRRMFATGDVDGFRAIAEPAGGVTLLHQPATGRLTATPGADGPTSVHFQGLLVRISGDPVRDAELHFGAGMPGVTIGAFPEQADLVAARFQRIDLNDIRALEQGAPGSGIATLAHEIQENYTAHSFQPTANVNRYEPSHAMGIEAENLVSQDVAGAGGRVAERNAYGAAPNTYLLVADFEHYYLVVTLTGGGGDPHVTNARRADRAVVGVHSVGGFGPRSATLPAAAAGVLQQAAAQLAAHPQATTRIEGYGDPGAGPASRPLSRNRAEAVRKALGEIPGAPAGALHAVPASAPDAAPGTVTITVAEPAP